jgi:hypothetical protein
MTTEVTTPNCEHDKLMVYAFVRLEEALRGRLMDEMQKLQHGACEGLEKRAIAIGRLSRCAADLKTLAYEMHLLGTPLVVDNTKMSIDDFEKAARIICDHYKPDSRKVALNAAAAAGYESKCLCKYYAKEEGADRKCDCEAFDSDKRRRLIHLLDYIHQDDVSHMGEHGHVGRAARLHDWREKGHDCPGVFKGHLLEHEKGYYAGHKHGSDPKGRIGAIKRATSHMDPQKRPKAPINRR